MTAWLKAREMLQARGRGGQIYGRDEQGLGARIQDLGVKGSPVLTSRDATPDGRFALGADERGDFAVGRGVERARLGGRSGAREARFEFFA